MGCFVHRFTVISAAALLLISGPVASSLAAQEAATPAVHIAAVATLPEAPLPQTQQQSPKPGAPTSQSGSSPSLSDLGLTPDQLKADDRTQALLDKRSHMLKVHQRLGLITALPILAACISGAGAVPERGTTYSSTTSRDVHVGIAGLGIGMYGLTAYYAAAAPRVGHTPARGGVKIHKYLIYVHAPGMVLTPILGAMAFNQVNSGQRVNGIASAHQAVAITTALAYGASILAVSYPIHLPGHKHVAAQGTSSPTLVPRQPAATSDAPAASEAR